MNLVYTSYTFRDNSNLHNFLTLSCDFFNYPIKIMKKWSKRINCNKNDKLETALHYR